MLKKLFFASLTIFMAASSATAASPNVFNHLGVGVGVGTTGIDIEVATPITDWVSMRAGVAFMPDFKFHAEADAEYYVSNGQNYDTDIDLDLGIGRTQGKVIFNFYPFRQHSSFFIAAGAYFGGNELIKIKGHSDELIGKGGEIEVGDYLIPVDDNGNVNGALKVNGFRPYVGLGFGRAIPRKLINFNVELGVQFQKEPKVYTSTGTVDVNTGEIDNVFTDIIKYLKVYPTLTFRISGKIF